MQQILTILFIADTGYLSLILKDHPCSVQRNMLYTGRNKLYRRRFRNLLPRLENSVPRSTFEEMSQETLSRLRRCHNARFPAFHQEEADRRHFPARAGYIFLPGLLSNFVRQPIKMSRADARASVPSIVCPR